MNGKIRVTEVGVFNNGALEEERRERMADYVELADIAAYVGRSASSFRRTVEAMGYTVKVVYRRGKYVNTVVASDAVLIVGKLGGKDTILSVEEAIGS